MLNGSQTIIDEIYPNTAIIKTTTVGFDVSVAYLLSQELHMVAHKNQTAPIATAVPPEDIMWCTSSVQTGTYPFKGSLDYLTNRFISDKYPQHSFYR